MLWQELEYYHKSGAYPFHMPGHKRVIKEEFPPYLQEWFRLDITEIPHFDNLHQATGILRQAMDRAAQLYKAERTYFLVNGSTCGILAALSAALPKGGKLLMSRSSHKSAYHAVLLRDLEPVYLEARKMDGLHLDAGITLQQVEDAVKMHPGIQAVFLTSPTYEGISSPIREIHAFLQEKGIPLIVDAAHGAHFGMADYLPENAVEAGADLVIHSLHKTLPAPTQTALLHHQGTLVSREKLENFLQIYETSSPSYPLMAAMEQCVAYLQEAGEAPWKRFYSMREQLSRQLQDLQVIGIFDYFSYQQFSAPQCPSPQPELCKMAIYIKQEKRGGWEQPDTNATEWLFTQLGETYHLQPEFVLPGYVLLFFTVFDEPEGYERLNEALHALDAQLAQQSTCQNANPSTSSNANSSTCHNANSSTSSNASPSQSVAKGLERSDVLEQMQESDRSPSVAPSLPIAPQKLRMSEAYEGEGEWLPFEAAVGRVSAGFVSIYPPGQPILVPGEFVTAEIAAQLQILQKRGFEIHGLKTAEGDCHNCSNKLYILKTI